MIISETVLVHVVLISFRDYASSEQRDEALLRLQELAQRCGGSGAGILFWKVAFNLDQRKNWHLVEVALFRDNDALQQFRSTRHTQN